MIAEEKERLLVTEELGDLAARISGSADIYGRRGRRPWASVNFVTAHDGFTLHDLVSYNNKHNEANGEHEREQTFHHRPPASDIVPRYGFSAPGFIAPENRSTLVSPQRHKGIFKILDLRL